MNRIVLVSAIAAFAACSSPSSDTAESAASLCAGTVAATCASYCGDNGWCCPTTTPFYCPERRQCYATAAEASAACGSVECMKCPALPAAESCGRSHVAHSCSKSGHLSCGGYSFDRQPCCPTDKPFLSPLGDECFATPVEALQDGGCTACKEPTTTSGCVESVPPPPPALTDCGIYTDQWVWVGDGRLGVGRQCCPRLKPFFCGKPYGRSYLDLQPGGGCFETEAEAVAACDGSQCLRGIPAMPMCSFPPGCSGYTCGAAGTCSNPYYRACGGGGCCGSGSPYFCPTTQTCHSLAIEAYDACGGASGGTACVLCVNQVDSGGTVVGGGGGSGGTCAPAPAGSCSTSGYMYCGNSACCPGTSPYHCASTNLCYATAAAASTACGGSCSACVTASSGGGGGGGSTGGSGSGCHDYASCIQFRVERGTACNSADSLDTRPRNVCSHSVALRVCIEMVDGRMDCGMKTLAPGASDYGQWTCHSTGRWLFWAADLADPARCAGFECATYAQCFQ